VARIVPSIDRRLVSWVAFAALVAVAVGTAGWGGTPAGRPARPPSPDPSPAAVSMSPARAAAVTRAVDLVTGDLPGAFRRVPGRRASDLDVADRMRLCGAAVPSEAFRVAAHGEAFVARGGHRVRTQVVVYRQGRVEAALARLRAAPPSCAVPVRPEPVEQPATLALRVRLRSPAGPALREELVVERREDVLVLMEVDAPRGSMVLDLARLLSERLEARLPDA
jgi:hypothetical protein